MNGAEFTEAKPIMSAQLAVLRIVPFTLASKALVLLKLSEMQSATSTEVSGMDHQSKMVRLQKPLQHQQGIGGPMAYGEAAAEQHGAYAKQLLELKPDNRIHCRAYRLLPYILRPGSHADIHTPEQLCVCLSLATQKELNESSKFFLCSGVLMGTIEPLGWCLCLGGTRSLCCPAAGR